MRTLASVLAITFCLIGCSDPAAETGMPDGWEVDGVRAWRVGFDTTGIYRDLSSFEAFDQPMEPVVYGAGERTFRTQLRNGVRTELFGLFQSRPETVDSLYQRYGLPIVNRVSTEGDFSNAIKDTKAKVYRALSKHYWQPVPKSKLGTPSQARQSDEIVSITYPEEMRDAGRVRLQVYVGADGTSQAMRILESVNPTLDTIALETVARFQWRPGYLHGDPVPAWATYGVRF
ncbi:MAG: energy transducer TonB [Bacteroidota bacterium]